MSRFAIIFSLLASSLWAPLGMACSQPPGYGYILRSVLTDYTRDLPVISNQKGQALGGVYNGSIPGQPSPVGLQTSWQDTTDGNGLISRLGYATPATWEIDFITQKCSRQDPIAVGPYFVYVNFFSNSTPQNVNCVRHPANVTPSPQIVQRDVLTTVTLSASGIGSGAASIVMYDANGSIEWSGTPNVIDANTISMDMQCETGGSYGGLVYDSNGYSFASFGMTVNSNCSQNCP